MGVNGTSVAEKSVLLLVINSSMVMEVNVISDDLSFVRKRDYTRALIVTDSMRRLEKYPETIFLLRLSYGPDWKSS